MIHIVIKILKTYCVHIAKCTCIYLNSLVKENCSVLNELQRAYKFVAHDVCTCTTLIMYTLITFHKHMQ